MFRLPSSPLLLFWWNLNKSSSGHLQFLWGVIRFLWWIADSWEHCSAPVILEVPTNSANCGQNLCNVWKKPTTSSFAALFVDALHHNSPQWGKTSGSESIVHLEHGISVVTLLCSIEMEKKKIESHLIGPRMSNTYIAVCGWAYSPINSIKIQRG